MVLLVALAERALVDCGKGAELQEAGGTGVALQPHHEKVVEIVRVPIQLPTPGLLASWTLHDGAEAAIIRPSQGLLLPTLVLFGVEMRVRQPLKRVHQALERFVHLWEGRGWKLVRVDKERDPQVGL